MMKKFTKRLWEKKNSKKGFTLVELIVVLVILAILAAIMVPALTGWIDRAKTKQVALEARTVYLAAQTIASEEYAKPSPDADLFKSNGGGIDDAVELANVKGKLVSVTIDDKFVVTDLVYVMAGDSYTATFDADGTEVWSYDPGDTTKPTTSP